MLTRSGRSDPFENYSAAYKERAMEALKTMALLVPRDSHVPKWFGRALSMHALLDEQVGQQWRNWDSRRVSQFKYYRSRLLRLEKEFENASPWSVNALWHDRRDGRTYITFWLQPCGVFLALIALALAVASALVAVIQAIEANDYAREANRLASLANEYASNASTIDASKTEDPIITFTTIVLAGTTNFISSNVKQNNINSITNNNYPLSGWPCPFTAVNSTAATTPGLVVRSALRSPHTTLLESVGQDTVTVLRTTTTWVGTDEESGSTGSG
jgi:hypothetical protein